jgi:hypothetical protein
MILAERARERKGPAALRGMREINKGGKKKKRGSFREKKKIKRGIVSLMAR